MNRDTAVAPLRLLQIDTDAAYAVDLIATGCSVLRLVGVDDARRALMLQRFDLILLDPGAIGDAASVVLLDTLPQRNVATPVMLFCDYLPSEACRDRANLCLLKQSKIAPNLLAMIRVLVSRQASSGIRRPA